MPTLQCPYCNQTFDDLGLTGQPTSCPNCNVVIPLPPAAPMTATIVRPSSRQGTGSGLLVVGFLSFVSLIIIAIAVAVVSVPTANNQLPPIETDSELFELAAKHCKNPDHAAIVNREGISLETLNPYRVEYGINYVSFTKDHYRQLYDSHGNQLYDRYGNPLKENVGRTVKERDGMKAKVYFDAGVKADGIQKIVVVNCYKTADNPQWHTDWRESIGVGGWNLKYTKPDVLPGRGWIETSEP